MSDLLPIKKEPRLTLKQEKFCRLYATEREYFGNGTQAYLEAYGVDLNKKGAYATARAAAAQNLTKHNILDHINKLLELNGLNTAHVDKQLGFLITQHADFTAKLGAIREYNKLKGRIVEKRENVDKHFMFGIIKQIHNRASAVLREQRGEAGVEGVR